MKEIIHRVRNGILPERLRRSSAVVLLTAGLLCGGFLIAAHLMLPLNQAIELGGDEGFELAKALLCHRGFQLYTSIWSDQPPLLTKMLAVLFGITGPAILWARLLTLVFSAALLFGLFDLVRRKSGLLPALAAFLLLVSAPLYLILSASVMQEVPAFSLAVLSAASLARWGDNRKRWWLAGSAVLLAAALMTKFTASLLIPAMLAELSLLRPRPSKRALCAWAAGVTVSVLLLGACFGIGGFSMLMLPHLEPRTISGVSKPTDFAFPANLIVEHWDAYITCAIGLFALFSRRIWRQAAMPLTLLATVTLVHLLHRPWWSPYYLHHAIPLAWLGGIGIRELVERLRPALQLGEKLNLIAAAAGVLIAVIVVQSALRFAGEVSSIRSARTIGSDLVIERILKYKSRTHWVYAQPVIYAFHAGIPVPPELAVLSLKRFWSGQMTWSTLLEVLQKYRPEQLLLLKTSMGAEWAFFLKENYVAELDDGEKILYVAKQLKIAPAELARRTEEERRR